MVLYNRIGQAASRLVLSMHSQEANATFTLKVLATVQCSAVPTIFLTIVSMKKNTIQQFEDWIGLDWNPNLKVSYHSNSQDSMMLMFPTTTYDYFHPPPMKEMIILILLLLLIMIMIRRKNMLAAI